MIHINKGDDPHEWTKDFQTESAKDDTLQRERVEKRIQGDIEEIEEISSQMADEVFRENKARRESAAALEKTIYGIRMGGE